MIRRTKAVSTPYVLCLIAQPVQRMVGRGVAQKNVALLGVSWNYTKICFKIIYFSRVRNWLGPIFSAAIIMIFVSCTNINEYVRNYQDCLTLGGTTEFVGCFLKSIISAIYWYHTTKPFSQWTVIALRGFLKSFFQFVLIFAKILCGTNRWC
jgi:hypothetical protein